jgi:hypothetical protein
VAAEDLDDVVLGTRDGLDGSAEDKVAERIQATGLELATELL